MVLTLTLSSRPSAQALGSTARSCGWCRKAVMVRAGVAQREEKAAGPLMLKMLPCAAAEALPLLLLLLLALLLLALLALPLPPPLLALVAEDRWRMLEALAVPSESPSSY